MNANGTEQMDVEEAVRMEDECPTLPFEIIYLIFSYVNNIGRVYWSDFVIPQYERDMGGDLDFLLKWNTYADENGCLEEPRSMWSEVAWSEWEEQIWFHNDNSAFTQPVSTIDPYEIFMASNRQQEYKDKDPLASTRNDYYLEIIKGRIYVFEYLC